MSYTVVLVEDEIFTLMELQQSPLWQELGLKLIGSATDGIQGEALIKETEPDIVIADIRLPGQDGLTMISKSPVSYAIILSGHSDFTYMQKAIRLGVFDYLLKPIDDAALEQTLIALIEKLAEENADVALLGPGQPLNLVTHTHSQLVNAAIARIRDTYSEPIGLQQIAAQLTITESYLSRLFKAETGINFMQYLNAVRINASLEALQDPSVTIKHVSNACGFPNPGYFAKVFKKFIGCLPSEYRETIVF
ncbi:MAG: response regulator transcription factor [Sphaerochaetaceae bacterium]